jgi:hypothetical protein
MLNIYIFTWNEEDNEAKRDRDNQVTSGAFFF